MKKYARQKLRDHIYKYNILGYYKWICPKRNYKDLETIKDEILSCSPKHKGGHRVPYSPGVQWNSENVYEPRMILDSWTKFSLGRGLESSSRRLLVPEQGRVLSFGIDFFPASSSPLLRRQRAEKFCSNVAPLNLPAHFPRGPPLILIVF